MRLIHSKVKKKFYSTMVTEEKIYEKDEIY
jgi:hypothetical protein